MEKSIENIWKTGFIDAKILETPKVTNLYNKKSISITERLKRAFKMNYYLILFIIVTSSIWGLMNGGLILASIFILIFIPIVILSHKTNNEFKTLDPNINCYDYLIGLKQFLDESIKKFTRVMKYFYAVMILTCGIGMWIGTGEHLKLVFPDMLFYNNIPVYPAIGLAVFVIISFIAGEKIYLWDLNIMYGRIFKRLDELIEDIEILKSETKE